MVNENKATLINAGRPGLPFQRNVGLDAVFSDEAFDPSVPSFITFYDDDFRPDQDWLKEASTYFETNTDIVGLTGRVLADGIKSLGLDEGDAQSYLSGERPAEKHWASGDVIRDISSMYGCNMAFRTTVFVSNKFDENLPSYGWQEDRDITGQAKKLGRTVYCPRCTGVHLGVKSARTSGVKFGYSQIANVTYLMHKGTVEPGICLRFVAKAFAANSFYTLTQNPVYDYPGRFWGNCRALIDLVRGKCHPMRILEL